MRPEDGWNQAMAVPLQFFTAALQIAYLRTQASDFTESAMEQFLEVCMRIAALQSPPAPVPPGTLQTLLLKCLDFVLLDMQGRLPCCEGLALIVPRLSPDDAEIVLRRAEVFSRSFFLYLPTPCLGPPPLSPPPFSFISHPPP